MKQNTWKKRIVRMLIVAGLTAMLCPVAAKAAQPYEKIASSEEWEVLKIVNQERLKDGKQAVSMFSSIQKASDIRAKEIIDYFAHERPNGTMCFTALDAQKISYRTAGENIAAGQSGPTAVMNAWMNSSGHRANILSGSFSHIGIGYVTGGSYRQNWVQLFVGGCSSSSVEVNDAGTENYSTGTSIDDMNRYLIVKCSEHGTSYVPIVSGMCTGYKSAKTGVQTITVRYQKETVQMRVTVGSASKYKKPAKVTGVKAAAQGNSALKLSWNKKSGNGYEIWSSTSKNGTYTKLKSITKKSTTSYTCKNLKSGKAYYFKVRAYKTVNGKRVYGQFSAVKRAVAG